MGCNGEATTGPGVCSAGLTTSVSLISPSYVNPPSHGGMCEPQTCQPSCGQEDRRQILGGSGLGKDRTLLPKDRGKATWSQARGAQVGQEAP